jgi:hypothetical protein
MNIAENFKQLPRTQKIALLFVTIYSIAILYYGITSGLESSGDQQSFYTTSKLLLQKIDPSRTTTDFLKSTNTDVTFSDIDRHGGRSMYPPSTHVLLIPFYAFLLSPVLSKYCWLFCNIMCLGIIYYVLCVRYLSAVSFFYKYILLCVLIGAASTKTNLGLGQTSLFSCAAFLLTLLLKDRHKWLSSIAFALAMAKPSLMALFAIYLLCRKEYRIVITACAIHLLLTAGISLWMGISPVTLTNNYLAKVSLLTFYKGTIAFYYQTNGVSFKSFLFALNMPQSVITIATVILYASAIAFILKIKNNEENFVLGITALLTLLVDYHQHYDFIVLLFMFPVFAAYAQYKQKLTWPFLYFLFLLYIPNFSRINFFGYATSSFFLSHMNYLFWWQVLYTGLYVLLLLVYMGIFNRNYVRTAI